MTLSLPGDRTSARTISSSRGTATDVELIWIERRIEHRIRFGRIAAEQTVHAERHIVSFASGRFAMVDDGLGFQLVPWRPALEPHLGQHITGTMRPGGSVDWSLGRGRGLGL